MHAIAAPSSTTRILASRTQCYFQANSMRCARAEDTVRCRRRRRTGASSSWYCDFFVTAATTIVKPTLCALLIPLTAHSLTTHISGLPSKITNPPRQPDAELHVTHSRVRYLFQHDDWTLSGDGDESLNDRQTRLSPPSPRPKRVTRSSRTCKRAMTQNSDTQ